MDLITSVIRLRDVRFERGFCLDMRQPSVMVSLSLMQSHADEETFVRFDEIVTAVTTSERNDSSSVRIIQMSEAQHPILSRLLNLSLGILKKMGMPVMSGVTGFQPNPINSQEWVVALPAIAQDIRAPQAAFSLACSLMNAINDGKNARSEELASAVEKLVRQFSPFAPRGVNTLTFLKTAHEMGIPWCHVGKNVYQFGWGSRSRWLDSSFTDETSTISASLARDKVSCSRVLRNAGLPVAKHQLVASAEQAVKVAEKMGYPVVIKPANLDGGAGVMVGLRDAQDVSKAFAKSSKLSNQILVEQFIGGEDYRIRICSGEVIGAVIRKAASVKGDGQLSVRALIEKTNAEREMQSMSIGLKNEHGTKPIVVDEEVQSWLSMQGLMLDSVIPEGRKVRLRGAANMNLGGSTWDVTDKAHPDNLKLALRAAAALRLDVAGVDLLLPNIEQSWKETGGTVCEVNAQPQFSSGDAHRRVLERLVRQQGRIPVVVVVDQGLNRQIFSPMLRALHNEGLHVELAASERQCYLALMSAHTDALIWIMDKLPLNTDGLPMDEIDVLIVESRYIVKPMPVQWVRAEKWIFENLTDLQLRTEQLKKYIFKSCINKELTK